jgi:hypothetical protein
MVTPSPGCFVLHVALCFGGGGLLLIVGGAIGIGFHQAKNFPPDLQRSRVYSEDSEPLNELKVYCHHCVSGPNQATASAGLRGRIAKCLAANSTFFLMVLWGISQVTLISCDKITHRFVQGTLLLFK